MANPDRGTYESGADDLRAFDFDEDDPVGEEGARLPLLVVIALVVLTAFVGVVWLAYTQGVERGRSEVPQTLAQHAAHRPSAVPQHALLTGLNIYQPAVPRSGHEAARSTAGPMHAASAPPALRPSSNGGPETFAAGTEPVHPFAAATPAPAPTEKPAATAKPPAITTAAPTKASKSASEPSIRPSSVLLQIGSYKSEAEARASWVLFKSRHPTAAQFGTDVKQVDLGDRGNWYRLRIGPFDDKDSAAEACAKLRSDGANCLIAR